MSDYALVLTIAIMIFLLGLLPVITAFVLLARTPDHNLRFINRRIWTVLFAVFPVVAPLFFIIAGREKMPETRAPSIYDGPSEETLRDLYGNPE